MPEPDFDQIARNCVEASRKRGEEMDGDTADAVAEELRLIWNARGAADIAKLEALDVIPDYVSDAALRRLDR